MLLVRNKPLQDNSINKLKVFSFNYETKCIEKSALFGYSITIKMYKPTHLLGNIPY